MISEKQIQNKIKALIEERNSEIKSQINSEKEENARLEERGRRYEEKITKLLKMQKIDFDSILAFEEEEGTRAINESLKAEAKLKNLKKDHNERTQILESGGQHAYLVKWIRPHYTRLEPFSNSSAGSTNGGTFQEGYFGGPLDVGPLESRSTGLGWSGPWAAASTVVDRYFYFIPSQAGYYKLDIVQEYYGTLVVQAFDSVFTSKYAEAFVTERLKVYMGDFLYHDENHIDLYITGQNIDRISPVSFTMHRGVTGFWAAGELAIVQLSQKFLVYAKGGGSRALLDLSTGTNNYVGEPILTVTWPIHLSL